MTHYPISPLITILGPTASGKTKLAVKLANLFDGEIISADSRQVYQGMDIGTGKDIDEYKSIPYHLIDIISPHNEYNLFNFATDFSQAFKEITARQKIPLLVGGTGMYLDAVLSRYTLTIANIDKNTRQTLEKKTESELRAILKLIKPDQHNTTDILSKERLVRAIEIANAELRNEQTFSWPEFDELILGIRVSRQELKKRIASRLKARFEAGMVEEVEMLLKRGISSSRIDNFGLEYRYILKYINGEINYNDMFQKLESAIVNFSKQQEKWFRNFEKKGKNIIWLDFESPMTDSAMQTIKRYLNQFT